MSKKWKKKFAKQKAMLINQTKSVVAAQPTSTDIEVAPDENELLPEIAPTVSKKVAKWQAQKEIGTQQSASLLPEVTRVKHDIKKISIIVGGIVIILILVYITDIRYGWIIKVADSIFGKLNFS